MKKIQLILENGDVYIGDSFGADLSNIYSLGEIVFNTSMTGYQEILSDPSYCDQMVVLTYPLIGNYGVNKDDFESLKPALKALIVREVCETPSNFRSEESLGNLLKKFNIPGISGIDTRALTKTIRNSGAMKAVFAPLDYPKHNLDIILKSQMPRDQIKRVSVSTPIHFPGEGKRIVLLDYGYKKNILKSLLKRNCDVVIVPFDTSYETISSYSPDGIMLSNGPGDPKDVPETLPVIKQLQEKYPLFAICMGHQLLALANGAETFKLKFGHRGANHPVKDLESNKVHMTSQNHGYAVDPDSVLKTNLEISQVAVNDRSVEGLRHKTLKAFSVQYHPEACPGPEDTAYLFDQFLSMVGE